jgi:hypothetical protein
VHCTPRQILMPFAHVLTQTLFPALRPPLGTLSAELELLLAIFALVPLAKYLPPSRRLPRQRRQSLSDIWPNSRAIAAWGSGPAATATSGIGADTNSISTLPTATSPSPVC